MDALDDVLRSLTFGFFGQGRHKTTLPHLIEVEGAVFLDVRSAEETARAPLPLADDVRSLAIPIHELPDRWREVPPDRLVGVFCASDVRSSMAYAYLRARGLQHVRIVTGGYAAVTEALKPGRLWTRSAGAPRARARGVGSGAS